MDNVTNIVLDGYKWNQNTSQFNTDFAENYNKDNDKGYFLAVGVPYPKRFSQSFTIFTWKTDN